jgi:2-polyprenyl-3-methyl-5-hydroxy-6-metoxy-1,4-benzoquinol methylase
MFTYDGSYPYLEEVNEGILRHIRPAPSGAISTVLDVGCGQGSLGADIAGLGHDVWGIENAAYAAGRAEERLSRLVPCDLTDEAAVRKELGDKQFGTIVFSDVLEHVYDPLSVLRSYLDYLAPDGRVLISLPNVANWQTRLALLFGRFDYQDSGVHDRTHIRFFTYRTAMEMVTRAGLQVDRVDSTPFIARAALPLAKRILSRRGTADTPADPRALIDSSAYRLYMRYLYPLEHRLGSVRKPLLAFRIILVASRPR